MPRPDPLPASSHTAHASIVAQLLLVMFIVELSVLEVLLPQTAVMEPVTASLLAAVSMATVSAIPLWFLLPARVPGTPVEAGRSPKQLLPGILAIIFVTELSEKFILSHISPNSVMLGRPLLDALLTIIIAGPLLWWYIARQHISDGRTIVKAPFKLFLLLLFAVFVLDLVEKQLLRELLPASPAAHHRLYSAIITTTLIAPFLWWLMVKPLQRAADTERVRFDTIQNQIIEAIVILDDNGKVIAFNPAAERIFGYAAAEAIGRPTDLLRCDPALGAEQLKSVDEQQKTRTSFSHEVSCCRKDGSCLQMEISISSLLVQGERQYMVIMRDMSARHAMEREMQVSAERLQIAVSSISDGIWDWDLTTNELYLSPHLLDLLGFRPGDIDATFSAAVALLHPEDHQRVMATINAAIEQQAPLDTEFRARCQSGDYRWFRCNGQLFCDDQGRGVRMAGAVVDITSRKADQQAMVKSERRFRQIFEHSEDAIIFFDVDSLAIIDANSTAEHLFGRDRTDLMSGGVESLCCGEDAARLREFIKACTRGGTHNLENFAGRRKKTTDFICSARGKILPLEGEPVIYCTFRDISRRYRLEKEAQEIQAKLIQANKMTTLGLMVTSVAHEINNPNNYIMTNAELLASAWSDVRPLLQRLYQENGEFMIGGLPFSEMDTHIPELFHGISDGAARIAAIITNLKSFAREDSVRPATPFAINEAVMAAVAILRHQLDRHTRQFRLSLAGDLPRVIGSSQQLSQVMINLLLNACQALPDPDCAIAITTSHDAVAQQIVVSIEDEGTGMSPALLGRITEPFFTTRLDSGGTGLGLSISQSIIKEHGGTLDFTSTPGCGTIVTVRLPAASDRSQGVPIS